MRLFERMERDGDRLFRWRGILPLLLLPAVVLALVDSVRIEALLGARIDDVWMYGCLALSLVGQAIRCCSVGFVPRGTSGRNSARQLAACLNTSGMYSIVRNPLHLGNFIVLLGIALALKVWVGIVVALAYALWIERIVAAEEAYLAKRFGAAYALRAGRTPAFVPRPGNWRAPDLPFSWRSVLRREYAGLLVIASAFLALELSTDLLIEGEAPARWISEDAVWVLMFAVAAVTFLALRLLKTRTGLLDAAGR